MLYHVLGRIRVGCHGNLDALIDAYRANYPRFKVYPARLMPHLAGVGILGIRAHECNA
jgi:hypothetical protein